MNLEQVLAATADGAFTTSPDGKIAQWNRAAEKMLGYTAREAVGRSCRELFVGRDSNGNGPCHRNCHVEAAACVGEPARSFDVQTRTRAGTPIWVNVSTLTVPDGRAGKDLTIHLFHDVTATRKIMSLIGERLAVPTAAPEPTGGLTPRELEILRVVATGVGTKGAAEQLRISPATIRNHVQNILGKLGAHSRLEAVAHATRHRLL
jgi:PAS domain S-box-containing protein